MNDEQVSGVLLECCPDLDLAAGPGLLGEWFVDLPPEAVHRVVQALIQACGFDHLSTITGQDRDGWIELLYHFWRGSGLTLRVRLPRQDPHVATLTDLIPGAAFYEREIWEMLHVAFDGHPDLRPLLLAEDWDGEPPLRNDVTETGERA